jgi:hypothetical protein
MTWSHLFLHETSYVKHYISNHILRAFSRGSAKCSNKKSCLISEKKLITVNIFGTILLIWSSYKAKVNKASGDKGKVRLGDLLPSEFEIPQVCSMQI